LWFDRGRKYFKEKLVPFLNDSTIVYKANVNPCERNELLGNALSLLHPISFEELFGLTVAEAMLCGTPVIAFNRGSMKELIMDGKTGFLVTTIAEGVATARNITHISKKACRDHAMRNFSSQVMAKRYIQLYNSVTKNSKYKRSRLSTTHLPIIRLTGL
jgi:glycosyltransferase involved in cell wall biosynthesis